MPRRAALLPLALLALAAPLAAAPAPASAELVPGKGLRGVELGMRVQEVRGVLGAPTRFRTVRHPIMGPVRQWTYGLTTVLFDGAGATAEVISLTTTSRAERTASGVGVGSTRRAVQRGVEGVRCAVEFTVDHCWLGDFAPGETVTDFAIGKRRKVVTRVTVGRVID